MPPHVVSIKGLSHLGLIAGKEINEGPGLYLRKYDIYVRTISIRNCVEMGQQKGTKLDHTTRNCKIAYISVSVGSIWFL